MSSEQDADRWFAHYGVSDLVRVSDPARHLYQAFRLEEATLRELAHPRVWWPWFRTAVLSGRGAGLAGPSWRQLTGTFVVQHGRILAAIRHRNSAGRPDYVALVHGLKLGPNFR